MYVEKAIVMEAVDNTSRDVMLLNVTDCMDIQSRSSQSISNIPLYSASYIFVINITTLKYIFDILLPDAAAITFTSRACYATTNIQF